jgi:hypothetical protein
MQNGRMRWKQCAGCKTITDFDENHCPACSGTELETLYLTPQEVMARAGPTMLRVKDHNPFYALLGRKTDPS